MLTKFILQVMYVNYISRKLEKIYINNKKVGVVTSGAPSPTLGKNIGFCMIEFDNLSDDIISKLNNPQESIGINIQVMVRNKLYSAKIVKKPFVAKNYIK